MKTCFYFILSFTLASCCLGNRKCNQDFNSSSFRIVNKASGNDLVFGPAKIYDHSVIKFYSLNGVDTIFHHYGAGANSNPGQDSLLFVEFDYRKYETVFVRISNTDIDTLALTYPTVDGSSCCTDYTSVKPISLNTTYLEKIAGGITILRK